MLSELVGGTYVCKLQLFIFITNVVPTRSTGYTHLRDAFTRALNTRLMKAKESGELTEEQIIQEGSPIRKLSGLFPNAPLAKKTALDICLTAPQPGKPRALVFRDLGSVESDWVATNLVLNYVGPDCPSPPVSSYIFIPTNTDMNSVPAAKGIHFKESGRF